MQQQARYFSAICLCGNDGTGKSTIIKIIQQKYPQYLCLERSYKTSDESIKPLIQQIKLIDKLTYKYPFQTQRATHILPDHYQLFHKNQPYSINVFWIMLDAHPNTIQKRVSQRQDNSIFQSKKCVQYYDNVYREMAFYYGMALVKTDSGKTAQQNTQEIMNIIKDPEAYSQIHNLALRDMSYSSIQKLDLQKSIQKQMGEDQTWALYFHIKQKIKCEQKSIYDFYYPELADHEHDLKLVKPIVSRWLINQAVFSNNLSTLSYHYSSLKPSSLPNAPDIQIQHKMVINLPKKCVWMYISNEGESKIIYSIKSCNQIIEEYYKKYIIIVLKSTIYSHKMQHSGQITDLGKIRAYGSMLFLQMMWRNDLKHAYQSINHLGIIFSQKVNTNKIEVVFKRQCVGTDKHAYHGIKAHKESNEISLKIQGKQDPKNINNLTKIVNGQTHKYKSAIYIRYDWRNPNHILKQYPEICLNDHPLYYPIENYYSKQTFFITYLQSKCHPLGDKCITGDMIGQYIDRQMVNYILIKLYCTMQYYMSEVGLQIIDGCVMIDQKGVIWSQINPDCMRVKSKQNGVDYDKDIWRVGGSSAKHKIIQKWSKFNQIIHQYLLKKRFHESQVWDIGTYPYQQYAKHLLEECPHTPYLKIIEKLIRGDNRRQIIATIDLKDASPVLVKSSIITEKTKTLQDAFSYLSVIDKVIIVDLDGALQQDIQTPFSQRKNPQKIRQYSLRPNNNLYAVGGGIRSQEALSFYQQTTISNLILSTNLQLSIQIKQPQCPIIELSINQQNQILTQGRTHNTHQNIIDKLRQLSKQGIKKVSITLVKQEGQLQGLNRKQIRELLVCIPGKIQSVIIAGGITTISDLQFLWGFEKCIPQLGSALWRQYISLSTLYKNMIKFKFIHCVNGQNISLCPAIIYEGDNILGEVFLDKEALEKTIQTRQLWRFSRQHGRVMLKGQSSGNIMIIKSMRTDCDQDCLFIGVQGSNFCHLGIKSCFGTHQNVTLESIKNHILSKKHSGGYSARIQSNPGLAFNKMIEQSWQMWMSQSKDHKIKEASDLLAHFLMYMNAEKIELSQITKQLHLRSLKKSQRNQIQFREKDEIVEIGIVNGKHYKFCDEFLQKSLGIVVIRPSNRNLRLKFDIANQQLFYKYLPKSHKYSFLGIKSKDIPNMLSRNKLKYCINYSIMMENNPEVSCCIYKQIAQGIKLCLIKRKNNKIEPKLWTNQNKGLIASEYPYSVTKYFTSIGIPQSCFTVMKISGSSQSYLMSDQFHFCDAIVISGTTLAENDLEVQAILQKNIYVGLYQALH